MKKKNIEVEFRSKFDKAKYDSLKKFFDKNAEFLGEDDKHVHYYILSDKLLKVTDNISKNSAKLTLKLNRIWQGDSFEEIEFPIARTDVEEAVRLFDTLNLTDNFMNSTVKRLNYLYKGVELALKFSPEWKHHLELEIVIDNESKKDLAEKQIKAVADELGVKLMTKEEMKIFAEDVEARKKKDRLASL